MAHSIVRPIGCYVYTHRKSTTGEVFYVGKGTAERAWDKHGRNVFWQRIAAKHGYSIHIESEGLLEFEAHEQERDLIAKLRKMGLRLANLTDGGEGTLNPTAETRSKIAAAHKGRKRTPEHIEKIRLGNMAGRCRRRQNRNCESGSSPMRRSQECVRQRWRAQAPAKKPEANWLMRLGRIGKTLHTG